MLNMRGKTKNFLFTLAAALMAGLFWFLLELKTPYFFLEDDNRNCTLGQFALYLRSLADGGFPILFNFHQFLGEPTPGAMSYLYPFVYLSVLLSQWFTGGIFWSVDIMALLHFTLAGAGMFLFLRELKTGEDWALLGALLWSANPFAVWVGALWWIVWPVYALLPWIQWLALRLFASPTAGLALCLALARLLLFFSAYGQYFAYAVVLEIIFTLILWLRNRAGTGRFAACYAASFAATFFLSLPLLLPTLHHLTLSAARSAPMDYKAFAAAPLHIVLWFQGLFWPCVNVDNIKAGGRLARLLYGNLFFTDWLTPAASHIGYAALAGLLFLFTAGRGYAKRNNAVIPLAACAAVSLLWASGALNRLVYLVPLLNRFRWHFKLELFLNFYLIALATCGLALWSKKFSARRGLFMAAVWCAVLLNMALLYSIKLQRNHPFPDKTEPLAEQLAGARILTLGYKPAGDFDPRSLGFNYASLWGLYQVGGYDPIVPKANGDAAFNLNYVASYCGDIYPNAVAYFRKWGVRWYVVKKSETARYSAQFSPFGITQAFNEADRTVFEDPRALPLLRWKEAGDFAPIKWRTSGNRLYAEYTKPTGKTIVAAFMYNPFFVYTQDGHTFVPALQSAGNQIELPVTSGGEIMMEYRNPYYKRGLALSGISLAFIIGGALFMRPKERRDRAEKQQ